MTRQTIATAALFTLASLSAALPARAGDIVQSSPSYDSPGGYDLVSTFPPATSTTIYTYTFSVPNGDLVNGITISGAFGNGDNPTTALSDYYLGFAANETAVEVAGGSEPASPCDDISDNCYSNQNGPTSWALTLTQPEIAALNAGLSGGSLDLTYTWENNTEFAFSGYDQYIYAGPAEIHISYSAAATPEPATFLICFGGIAGIVSLRRRFRKV